MSAVRQDFGAFDWRLRCACSALVHLRASHLLPSLVVATWGMLRRHFACVSVADPTSPLAPPLWLWRAPETFYSPGCTACAVARLPGMRAASSYASSAPSTCRVRLAVGDCGLATQIHLRYLRVTVTLRHARRRLTSWISAASSRHLLMRMLCVCAVRLACCCGCVCGGLITHSSLPLTPP